jgi:hypothetical protein
MYVHVFICYLCFLCSFLIRFASVADRQHGGRSCSSARRHRGRSRQNQPVDLSRRPALLVRQNIRNVKKQKNRPSSLFVLLLLIECDLGARKDLQMT